MQYHKINGVYKRYTKEDKQANTIPDGKVWGEFIDGEWATPEFEYLKDAEWEFTEKVDGMNCRIIIDPMSWEVSLKGKTDKADIPEPLKEWYKGWLEKHEDILFEMFDTDVEVILYGEGVGKKIQKGKHGFEDYEVILFDIKIGKYWLKRDHVSAIASDIGLRTVSVVERSTLQQAIDDMRDRAINGEERSSAFGDWKMEGIVGTPTVGLLDRSGARIITKLKYTDFREKTGDKNGSKKAK